MNTSSFPVKLLIRPFETADQPAAKALVLAGLVDHWGVLDPALNPDLNDISCSYANGLFLIGMLDGRLVATGAYLPHPSPPGLPARQTCQVVRMSVARELRGRGLGRQMLAELLARAAGAGYRHAVLETTETWDEVVRFYLRSGFQITHRANGDVYFFKEIAP